MAPATVLPNALARKLFLSRHALLGPVPRDLPALIDALGFVQLDSVLTLARAHDMILWSRRPAYRPPHLGSLHAAGGTFEHWTHDAAILPIASWPHWRHRFARDRARMDARWPTWHGDDFRAHLDRTLQHVADHGPTLSGDLADGPRRSPGWWNWHPGKVALEYLWRAGDLSVLRRDGFQKVYDLTERVIPAAARAQAPSLEETTGWAASAALDRLGFATPGELSAFHALLTPQEAQAWARGALARGEAEEVMVESHDGALRRSLARPGALAEAQALPDPGPRLRLLSPFDPALRDRARRAPVRLPLPHRDLRARRAPRLRLLRVPRPGGRPPRRPDGRRRAGRRAAPARALARARRPLGTGPHRPPDGGALPRRTARWGRPRGRGRGLAQAPVNQSRRTARSASVIPDRLPGGIAWDAPAWR